MLSKECCDPIIDDRHRQPVSVKLVAHLRGLVRILGVQRQHIETPKEGDAPIWDLAPLAVSGPEQLSEGGSWDGEPCLIDSPRGGPFAGVGISLQEVEAVSRVQRSQSLSPSSNRDLRFSSRGRSSRRSCDLHRRIVA